MAAVLKSLITSSARAGVRFARFSARRGAIGRMKARSFGSGNYSIIRKLQLSSIPLSEQRVCWKCQTVVTKTQFVCSKCECLQSPDFQLNHFELFEIPETFDVDVPDLMNKFKNLQRRFHPDKFSQKSRVEQDYSAIYSAKINRAYQTLLKPVERGLYILQVHGKPLLEETVTMSPEFLAQVMEINEELSGTESMAKIKQIASETGAKTDKLTEKLSQELKNKNWDAAQKTLAEMKYYANIEEKAKSIVNREELEKM